MTRMRTSCRRVAAVLLATAAAGSPSEGQRPRGVAAATGVRHDAFDNVFRKYSKRYFGPAFDWRLFKAQGIAESNLQPDAKSWVGARGVMQLMPSTYRSIFSEQEDLKGINDPEMNIAAGISYDRVLWRLWEEDSIAADRLRFMLASYNAGRLTIINARRTARRADLDDRVWANLARVAARVPRWRHRETLEYLGRIESAHARMDREGAVDGVRGAPPGRKR